MFILDWNEYIDYKIVDGESPKDEKMLEKVYGWISGAFDGSLFDAIMSEEREDARHVFDLNCYEVEEKEVEKDVCEKVYDVCMEFSKKSEERAKKQREEDERRQFEQLKKKFGK